VSAKQKTRISRGETALTKLLPLVFLLVIFFNKLPFVPILSGLSLENLLTGILFLAIAGAFAFEMQKTRVGGKANFGTVILAVFVLASFFVSIIFFLDAYDFGTNRTIDVLLGVYFAAAILLLIFQATTQLVTGTRARISRKEKV